MQESDWARPDGLSASQELYAAADVAVPCLIYRFLQGYIDKPVISCGLPSVEPVVPVSTVPDNTPRWSDVSLTTPSADFSVDELKTSQSTTCLTKYLVSASKAMMKAFSRTRSSRRCIRIPCPLKVCVCMCVCV